MVAIRSQKRFRRDPLFSGWQQLHVRAPGLFPARRESGCGNHVRCPGGPRLRRHLRQSEARTRLVQLAYPAAAEPVLAIRATIGTSLTGVQYSQRFDAVGLVKPVAEATESLSR